MIVRDDEYLDFSQVPESRGIPKGLHYLFFFGLACIFAIGGATCWLSGYGHHWPSTATLRVPLGTLHQ
jgi:hypothetical protein